MEMKQLLSKNAFDEDNCKMFSNWLVANKVDLENVTKHFVHFHMLDQIQPRDVRERES